MPDQDGYPLEEELEKIKAWDIKKDGVEELLDLIEGCWHWPDCCFVKKTGFTHFFRKPCIKLELHTGGWSGNEEIMGILQSSDFWILYWVKSERGGHYYFEIPMEKK